MKRWIVGVAAVAVMVVLDGTAHSSTISAVGNVDALTDVSQLGGVLGTADFNEGPHFTEIPLDQYAGEGLTFQTGLLSDMLPGVTTAGYALPSRYYNFSALSSHFATDGGAPIAGGGSADGFICMYGGAATFDSAMTVTQVGLTASTNNDQYLTAWDKSGNMLGQVNWDPTPLEPSFIGIDTRGVPIGLVTYINDDLWGGETYLIDGYTTYSDNWMWAEGSEAIPEPSTVVTLTGLLGMGLIGRWWRRKRAA